MGVTERKAREKAITRDRILEAARDLFVREGYVSVSIRRIADQLEISPGSIYLHFEDKAAIFEQICRETFERLNRRMSALVDDPSPAIDRLRRAGRLYCEFGLDHPQHYLVTFVLGRLTMQSGPPADSDRLLGMYKSTGHDCLENLRALVVQAIAEGSLKTQDPDEATQVLWSGMHGLVSNIITKCGFPWVERSRLIDSMVNSQLDGLRPRQP